MKISSRFTQSLTYLLAALIVVGCAAKTSSGPSLRKSAAPAPQGCSSEAAVTSGCVHPGPKKTKTLAELTDQEKTELKSLKEQAALYWYILANTENKLIRDSRAKISVILMTAIADDDLLTLQKTVAVLNEIVVKLGPGGKVGLCRKDCSDPTDILQPEVFYREILHRKPKYTLMELEAISSASIVLYWPKKELRGLAQVFYALSKPEGPKLFKRWNAKLTVAERKQTVFMAHLLGFAARPTQDTFQTLKADPLFASYAMSFAERSSTDFRFRLKGFSDKKMDIAPFLPMLKRHQERSALFYSYLRPYLLETAPLPNAKTAQSLDLMSNLYCRKCFKEAFAAQHWQSVQPGNTYYLYQEALKALEEKDLLLAHAKLSKILSIYPEHMDALILREKLYRKGKHKGKALETQKALVALWPQQRSFRYKLAHDQKNSGRNEEAVQSFQGLLENWGEYLHSLDESKKASVYQGIAHSQFRLGAFKEAAEAAALRLRVESKKAVAYGSYSFYLLFTKQYAEAEQAALDGLALNPKMTFIQTNRFSALVLQGKVEEARSLYQQQKDTIINGMSFSKVTRVDWKDLIRAGVLKDAHLLEEILPTEVL